jgi:hypothetical protein
MTQLGRNFFGSNQPKEDEKATQVKAEEKATTQEPSIPVSKVEEMVQKMVAEQLAKAQPQTTQEPAKKKTDFGIADAIEGLPALDYKDRWYTTKNGSKPVTFGIRNRHKKNSPLQWRNPVTKIIHTLKYASNQTTFLAEFQNGEALIQSILMRDGKLFVPKENILLQQFLAIHPDANVTFVEIDKEANAKKKVSSEELVFEAGYIIRTSEEFKLRCVAMVALSNYDSQMSTFEIKEKLYQKAKTEPKKLIDLFNDKFLEVKGLIKTSIARDIVDVQGKKYLSKEGEVIFQADYSGDELGQFALFLQSDSKGKDFYEYLKHSVL